MEGAPKPKRRVTILFALTLVAFSHSAFGLATNNFLKPKLAAPGGLRIMTATPEAAPVASNPPAMTPPSLAPAPDATPARQALDTPSLKRPDRFGTIILISIFAATAIWWGITEVKRRRKHGQ